MAAVADDGLDPAFMALALALPSEDEMIAHIAGAGRVPDPSPFIAPAAARGGGGAALGDRLAALRGNAVRGPFRLDAAAAGRRALRARALALITALDPGAARRSRRSRPPTT